MKVGFARFLLLAGLLGAASPALALSPARYAGETSQGTRVALRLSPARRVTLRIYYRVSCSDGRKPRMTYTNISGARLAHGRFAAAGIYKGSLDGSTNDYRIRGVVTSAGAHGIFSLHATTTRQVHCRSGTVTWTARRS
jgi:hypothetical protein